MKGLWRRLPAVALAILLAAYAAHAIGRLRASRILWEVETTTIGMVGSKRLSPAVLAANLRRLRMAMDLDSLEVGIPVALGGQYLLLERAAPAQVAYRMALELEQRPEIYLNLGRAELMAGDAAAAVLSFHRAVLLAPSLIDEVPEELRDEVRYGSAKGVDDGQRGEG